MKIAFVTTGDPTNKNSWSGTDYYTFEALKKQGHMVYAVTIPKWPLWKYIFPKIIYKILGKTYMYNRSNQFCKYCSRKIKSSLQADTDVIFALGAVCVSQLKCDIPIVYYTDGVFSLTSKMYGWTSNMSSKYILQQEQIEINALQNSSKAIVSSACVVDEMINHYNALPDKIELVPMGANLDTVPTTEDVKNAVKKRPNNKLDLLFVGVDWERKGGGNCIRSC